MAHTKIDVREENGKVVSAVVRFSLGPWPLKNWSWTGIHCSTVERAKLIRDLIESMPSYELKYEAYLMAPYDMNLTVDKVRTHMNDRIKREKSVREYTL